MAKTGKFRRALPFVASAAIAAGSMLAGGCRAEYVQDTMNDRRHYEVLDNYRQAGFTQKGEKIRKSAVEGLNQVGERKLDDFSKYDSALGESYAALARRVAQDNAAAENAIAGSDTAIVNLYESLNKKNKSHDKLTTQNKDAFIKSGQDLEKLVNELCSEQGYLAEKDLVALKVRAYELKDKDMIKKIDELSAKFRTNASTLRTDVSVKNGLLLSEGLLYCPEGVRSLEAENALERFASGGVDYKIISDDVLEKCKVRTFLMEQAEHVRKHFARDSSIDPDEEVRAHRHQIVQHLWAAYSDDRLPKEQRLSGKEFAAAIWRVDYEFAKAGATTNKDGKLKKAGKRFLGAITPGYPFFKAAETMSHGAAPDTAEGFAKKRYGNDPYLMENTMKYVMMMRDGATNGGHVVGTKSYIIGDSIFYVIESAGQVVGIVAGINSLSGGGGGGGAADTTPSGPTPPGPHPH